MLRKCLLIIYKPFGRKIHFRSIDNGSNFINVIKNNCIIETRKFHLTKSCGKNYPERSVIVFKDFEGVSRKTKNAYLEMIKLYEGRHPQRRGHVEFIYAALKNMEEFGVERDLQVYKALIDVMPKGKMVATNLFQVEFMHYPKQQQCIIDLLEKMEDNGVMPDAEMETMLINIFGNKAFPLRKYWRMMYWMPKFKNKSPWLLPNPVPDDALELAKLAIERITSVDLRSDIDVLQCSDVEDSIDKTWIVSGVSPAQVELLNKHPEGEPVFVEAGGRVWLRRRCVNYFVLKTDRKMERKQSTEEDVDDVSRLKVPFFSSNPSQDQLVPAKTVHEQDDGTVYGVCATGTSSKDSALSWIRLLQKLKSPILANTPVLFRFRQPTGDLVPFTDSLANQNESSISNN